MSTANQWIVGIDLRERSHGALVFAGWLGAAGEHVTGVHVLEEWRRPYTQGDVLPAVEAAVAETTRKLGCPPPAPITSFDASVAETGLARAADGAAGLILGRAAGEHGAPLVRLGTVARKLLRELPAPVIVVPPDLTAVADGPVLLATDLGPATAGAVAFARSFAARHARPLEFVHVGEEFHSSYDESGEPPHPALVAAQAEYHAEIAQNADTWATEHGLSAIPRHLLYGDPVLEIAALAATRSAALVVVGSRRLGLAARIFLSSAASALASIATCPVAVIPPPN